MKKTGKEYLENLINTIEILENIFRIKVEGGGYIFGAFGDETIDEYFSISVIYDTVVDLNKKIKLSFFSAIDFNLDETLDTFNPFSKISDSEFMATYHIENMIYRVNILWDLLSQICNIYFHTGLEQTRIYATNYFEKYSSEDYSFEIIKKINNYIKETDNTDVNPWQGNYNYLKEYRNQLTHRNSPGITSISRFNSSLRPPSVYLLHRVTEDYTVVSSFLSQIINEYLEKAKDYKFF